MFQNHIHNLRGIAILGIVGAHSIHAFDWMDPTVRRRVLDADPTLQGPGWSDYSVWFRIFDTLCNQSSILFFFIAGYLFQHLSARFSYPRYMKRKLTTVIIPYLILSTPALVVSTGWGAGTALFTGHGAPMIPQDSVWPGFYDLAAWQQMIAFFVTGKHLAPFWFVPTIALFYILAPLLLAADRRPWLYGLLPLLMAWSAYAGRDYFFGPIGKGTYLFSVYFLGMFFSHYKKETMRWSTRLRWPLVAVAATLFALNVLLEDPHHGILYALKVCLAPIALHWLQVWDGAIGKKFDYLAHVSFGLFFIHGYFIAGLRLIYERYTQRPLPDGNVVFYLLFVSLILALSLLVLSTARRVLKERSRLFVGC